MQKQIDISRGVDFLKEFTKEIIINTISPEKLEQLKRKELEKGEFKIKPKIRQELTTPIPIHAQPEIQHPIITTKEIIEEKEKSEIKAEETKPKGFYLDKIMPMVLDPNVISIECPGTGKYVIVRTTRRAMRTRIMLDQEDIEDIIQRFSDQARIPRIGGVFKAIVDNLVMTAIDHEAGAKRFIITKTHPHDSEYL